MAMVGEVHVVPSGKVYRQIFDAEVQLVRSLGEARCRSIHFVRPLDRGKIPLVGVLETRAGGQLSHRQQLWVESMPNDGFTENPVFYRETASLEAQKTQDSQVDIDAREVRGLADVIVPERSDRNIIQHVADRRRARHEATIDNLQRELVRISKEMEPSVLKAGNELQKKLDLSEQQSQLRFQKIEGNADLSALLMKDFKEVWSSIACDSLFRRQMIKDACDSLTRLEENRAQQIGAVLKGYTLKLEKICYIMPAEVYRFIHKEAMMINQAILANRRAIAKLAVNLSEADLKQEGAQRLRWQDRMKEWKVLWKGRAIQKFRTFMKSEKVQNPLGIQRDMEVMVREQIALNEKRMQILTSVSDRLPPTCTKSQVSDWYSSLVALNKKIDCLNVQFLNRVRLHHEKVLQMCLAELQKSKGLLLDMKVFTKDEAEKLVGSDFFPLVGQLQNRFEQELELMDRSLECLAKQTEMQSKDLFKFTQGAVHLWDVLEIGLARHEKGLQKQLHDCRQQHDGENQAKEANLDMILDRLRQESSQEGLQTYMQKALSSLEDIRAGYDKFYNDQVAIVGSYPNSILSELNSYSSSLSQYFGVKEVFKQTSTVEEEKTELVKICITEDEQSKPNTVETADMPQDQGQLPPAESEIQDVGSSTVPVAPDDLQLESEPRDGTEVTEHGIPDEQPSPESEIKVATVTTLPAVPEHGTSDEQSPPESEIKAATETALPAVPEHGTSDEQPPPDSEIKAATETALPAVPGDESLQQTGQPEGIITSESGGQSPMDIEQEDKKEATDLQVTVEEFPEESEESDMPVEAKESPQVAEMCKPPPNSFTTSNGNVYNLLSLEDTALKKDGTGVFITAEQSGTKEAFMTEIQPEGPPPPYLEHIAIPETLINALKERVRLGFYEHLENWFDKAMANSESVVLAKKEELKSELDLRLHLHQPRSQRIEKDIHNVRAAELLLHSDRVERHYDGVLEALAKMKNLSIELRDDMKEKTDAFRKKVSDMEPLFMNANKSEKLAVLTKSLYASRDKHVEGIKISMRNYRQTLEGTLGMLRDSNAEFIKSFRLFAEGGNFSPEEVEMFRKSLQEAAGRIDGSEGFIMVDLEGVESKCIEQAKDVVRKFEVRFQSLTTDMNFLESIQRLLTNLQVKIKSEVAKSNLQSQKLQESLETLSKKIDACAHPNLDKEAVTPEELYDFMKSLVGDVVQRCNYLKCLLDPALHATEPPLQGPFAAAARQESKVTFASIDSLLQPCKLGRPMNDDAALSLIKSLSHSQQQTKQGRALQSSGTVSQQNSSTMIPHPPTPEDTGTNAAMPASAGDKKKMSSRRASLSGGRKANKVNRFDKNYHVFGEKLEECSDLKGTLNAMLWESNNAVLAMAEEFYKKKEKRMIGRSDFLQETFDECAEVLVLKMLSYQGQGDEYHNACLHEFREQLEECEKLLAQVPPLIIGGLRKQHQDKLWKSIGDIQASFSEHMQEWDATKEGHRKQLRPSLGHPDNQEELQELCQLEQARQQELLTGISINTKLLKDCAVQCADDFVTALAAFAESLLLEFDESLNVDDVQTAWTEVPKEKLFTLIRRRRAGFLVEDMKYKPVVERGGRMWPGINRIEIASTTPEDMAVDVAVDKEASTSAVNGGPRRDTSTAAEFRAVDQNASTAAVNGTGSRVTSTTSGLRAVDQDARTAAANGAGSRVTSTPSGLRAVDQDARTAAFNGAPHRDTSTTAGFRAVDQDASTAAANGAGSRVTSTTSELGAVDQNASTAAVNGAPRGDTSTTAGFRVGDQDASIAGANGAGGQVTSTTSGLGVVEQDASTAAVNGGPRRDTSIVAGDGAIDQDTNIVAIDGGAGRDTASVTTAKTSLAHVSVVEARDAAYKEFRCSLEQVMAQIMDMANSQVSEAQRWEKWWQQAVLEINQLYA
ncbi:coiled-coil domain-containing protein 180 [Ambystoma mexicanum]|uniref:coiled-coil domain-containing protein 180 n=1 Tax=Ambystoma mexicanum TaxID=8296 RepID=UPI0037E70EA5